MAKIKKTFCFTIAYNGSNYHGWQRQNEVHTVQDAIETVLRNLFQSPKLNIQCTGRTDTGVHALGQVASLTIDCEDIWTCEKLLGILNARLSGNILIRSITEENHDFNARYSAIAKMYIYVIKTSDPKNPFENLLYLHYKKTLNIERIKSASKYLIGEYDFRSFASKDDRPEESKVRKIYSIEIEQIGEYVYFIFTGSGFLYKMVRTLTGFFLDVSRGYIQPEQTLNILNAMQRTNLAVTAPARGLYLAKVYFDNKKKWDTIFTLNDPFLPGIKQIKN